MYKKMRYKSVETGYKMTVYKRKRKLQAVS